MRGSVQGEQYAQVNNPDPFASPAWRSPVYRTPEGIIYLVRAIRLLWRLTWFLIRHPLLVLTAGALYQLWRFASWPGLAITAAVLTVALAVLRWQRPDWFALLVSGPLRDRWRWWYYRRRWEAVLTIAGLAPCYQGRVLLPVLGQVQARPCTDLVPVRLVSGQTPKLFSDRAEELAHGFGALVCRVRTATPGRVV